MRHMAMTLVVLLAATATALAQNVIYEERIDPITDENTSVAGFSTAGYDQWTDDHGHLVVRCDGPDAYEVAVLTNAYLGSPERFNIVYRFDSDEPVNESWSGSTSNTAAFAPRFSLGEFMRKLLSSSRFVWRVTAFDDDQHTLVFDVPSDLGEYVDRLGCVALD